MDSRLKKYFGTFTGDTATKHVDGCTKWHLR
jgi:hypothetical protein